MRIIDGPKPSSREDREQKLINHWKSLNTASVDETERAGELDRAAISVRLVAEVNFAYNND